MEERSPKRRRVDEKGIKFIVPPKALGTVIGKGGQTMKQIMADTNADIQISRPEQLFPGTEDQVCVIKGGEEEVAAALPLFLENLNKNGAGGVAENPLAVRIAVPNNSAGHIIGKGGETIKQLQASTMCQLKVGERDPQATERLVTVRGAPENVLACLHEIFNMMKDEPALNEDLFTSYGDDRGGKGKGKGSHPGPPMEYGKDAWDAPAEGKGYGKGGDSHGHAVMPEVMTVSTAISFLVPNDAVGAIIGRGGGNLKALRQECRVDCTISAENVEQSDPSMPLEKSVTLQGTVEGVQAAMRRILRVVHAEAESQASWGKGSREQAPATFKGERRQKGEPKGEKGEGKGKKGKAQEEEEPGIDVAKLLAAAKKNPGIQALLQTVAKTG